MKGTTMATLQTLITTARKAKSGKAQASEGRWKAVRHDDGVCVYHYATQMVLVTPDNEIIPVNAGWGSMTDKKGIRTIARGIGVITSYNEVFGISPKRGTTAERVKVTAERVKVDVVVRGKPIFARARQAEAQRQALLNPIPIPPIGW